MITWSGARVRVPRTLLKLGSWGTAKIQARLESGVSMRLPGCVRLQRTPNPSGISPAGPRVNPGPGECGRPGVHTPRESHCSIKTNSPDGDSREYLHWEGAPSQGFNALGWRSSQGSAIPVGTHVSFPIQLDSCLKAFGLWGKTFIFFLPPQIQRKWAQSYIWDFIPVQLINLNIWYNFFSLIPNKAHLTVNLVGKKPPPQEWGPSSSASYLMSKGWSHLGREIWASSFPAILPGAKMMCCLLPGSQRLFLGSLWFSRHSQGRNLLLPPGKVVSTPAFPTLAILPARLTACMRELPGGKHMQNIWFWSFASPIISTPCFVFRFICLYVAIATFSRAQ